MYELCGFTIANNKNASRFLYKSKNRRGFETELHNRLTERFKYVNSAEMGDWNVHFCARVTGQGNHTEFIPTA